MQKSPHEQKKYSQLLAVKEFPNGDNFKMKMVLLDTSECL